MNEQGITNEPIRCLADVSSDRWWVMALRGLAAVVFGVLAFAWPGVTLLTLVYLFGAYALVNGALTLFLGLRAPGLRHVGTLIFESLISIAAGVFAFLVPGITALTLVFLIAFWAIVGGITEIVAAIRLRKVIAHEWLLIGAGVLSVIFGLLLLAQPGVGALALIWWIGAFAIVFGFMLFGLAFRMRSWRGQAPTAPTAATPA